MIYYISLLVISLYIVKISEYIFAWQKKIKINKTNAVSVSVIIALRNESKNINNLISSLKNQTYPKSLLEIILVDDNSTDNTYKLLCEATKGLNNFKITQLDINTIGKKNAILKGIYESQNELIILTDADCSYNKNWILEISNYYISTDYKLISSPVKISENNFFANLQSLEFFSLNISGGASILSKKPILVNSANLAFSREYFNKFTNSLENEFVSGDDMFLLLNFKKKYPDKIGFLKSSNALVYTKPAQNLKDFFSQRKRWMSKTKIYTDFDIAYFGILNSIVNVGLIILFVVSFFYKDLLFFLFSTFLTKIIIDLIFFAVSNKIYKIKNLYLLFPIIEIIYPFYISFMLIFGFLGKTTWKERIVLK